MGSAAAEEMHAVPFRDAETFSSDIRPHYKWTGVIARMSAHKKPLRPFVDNKGRLQGLALDSMARKINDMVNKYDYVADMVVWKTIDYWATPAEFFANGGDCEDYAIAKYEWLRFLGVPEENLRLAILHDRIRLIPHAVLILYIGSKAMILDSQIRDIRDSASTSRYRMIYSINRQGWSMPIAPESFTVSMVEGLDQIEPAGGDDLMALLPKCLTGENLPECINAIAPKAR